MRFVRTFLFVLSVPVLISCAKKSASHADLFSNSSSTGGGGGSSHSVTPTMSGNLCYQGTIKTIIERNCLACHGNGGMAFPTLATYSQVVAVKASALNDINKNQMPPGGIWATSMDKMDLATWLAMTNPPDACSTTPTPTPTPNPSSTPTPTPKPSPTPTSNPNPSPTPPPQGLPRVDHQILTIPLVLKPDDMGDVMYSEIVPTGLNPNKTYYVTGTLVEAIETETGKASSLLHHLLVMKGPANASAKQSVRDMDEMNMSKTSKTQAFFGSSIMEKLGTSMLGKAFNLYGGMVKGTNTFVSPAGSGIPLKGSDSFSLSVHMNTLFAPATVNKNVRLRISLTLVEKVERVSYISLQVNPTWMLDPMAMMIKAGDPAATHDYTLDPFDWVQTESSQLDFYGTLYHMHNRGSAAKTTLISGNTLKVINQDNNYNYAVQYAHMFPKPITVKKVIW